MPPARNRQGELSPGLAKRDLWCELVALACELIAWTQMLALTGKARRWEPKRLRLRVFAVAGRLVSGGRRLRLRLAERWPWAADHRRDHPPAGPPVRLTSRNSPTARKEKPPGPVEPRPPARQPGSQARPHAENQALPNTSGHHNKVTKDRG
jgi:Transposase DDE domain group 1